MKYSIKRQITLIFVVVIILVVSLVIAVNAGFLESYYLYRKQSDIRSVYNLITHNIDDHNLLDDQVRIEIDRMLERYNLSLIITNENNQIIFFTDRESTGPLYLQMLGYIFEQNQISGQLLTETRHYQFWKMTEPTLHMDFLEMWVADYEGFSILLRSPLESIRENAAIANTFLIYVGFITIVIGGAVFWFATRKITAPLQELVSLSKQMTELQFDVRYQSGGHNEIGQLGENFNLMSAQLEQTIKELKHANLKLQADIEDKEKLASRQHEFIGNISHELKTPITLIQGYAEGLMEGLADDTESREFYCSVIVDESKRMSQLVSNLLTINHIESGTDELEIERFNLITVIQDMLSNVSILCEQQNIRINLVSDQTIYVWADQFRTEQILMNYITNALHHVDHEKRIEIAVTTEDSRIRVSVFNSGNPIPEEDLSSIWDKFYKVDKSHTRTYGGSGIGLSIVKAIVESMNQEYGVCNYNNGVEFWFTLEGEYHDHNH